EELPPSWLSRRTRGMRGLALPVASVNYMENSLGKVKKAHRTRAVIMHSNSQQLTVDSLFREPSIETCGTCLHHRRRVQWCCSTAVLSATGYIPRKPRKRHPKRIF